MRSIKNLKLMFLVAIFISCKEVDLNRCFSPPCGEINENTFNVSILLSPGSEEISNVTLRVSTSSETIPLTGIDRPNNQFYSCWHSTDLRLSASLPASISYELGEKSISGNIEGASILTNQMIILIYDTIVSGYDYIECIE